MKEVGLLSLEDLEGEGAGVLSVDKDVLEDIVMKVGGEKGSLHCVLLKARVSECGHCVSSSRH